MKNRTELLNKLREEVILEIKSYLTTEVIPPPYIELFETMYGENGTVWSLPIEVLLEMVEKFKA